MDGKCSGKEKCEIIVGAVVALLNIQPCPVEVVAYLEASYTCLEGTLQ